MIDFSLVSFKTPWLRGVATMAPCSQLVAKTKKTPFYGPLTSGFAVHCVYSGLPISLGNRPNVPKPTRKNNFRRVQLLSAPLKPAQTDGLTRLYFITQEIGPAELSSVRDTVRAD